MKNITLLILSIITFSCNTNDDGMKNNSENFTEIPVDSYINFMPQEIYITNTVETPSLILKLVTVEDFGCSNYGLSTTTSINGNELMIRLNSIIVPDMCLTSIGPAMSYIDLPENTTKITFVNEDIVDTYSIEINHEKVTITPIEINFTNSLFDKTFRFPENSFAYICGTNTTNTNIYSDFFTILEQNPNFVEFQFEGDGRIPYPETTDGNWVNHPSKFFTYTDFEEFNTLGNILNDYSSNYIEENSGVTISINSWNNVKYYSWITN